MGKGFTLLDPSTDETFSTLTKR